VARSLRRAWAEIERGIALVEERLSEVAAR
jgi:hypothetical protein